jgi:hypothetical protein
MSERAATDLRVAAGCPTDRGPESEYLHTSMAYRPISNNESGVRALKMAGNRKLYQSIHGFPAGSCYLPAQLDNSCRIRGSLPVSDRLSRLMHPVPPLPDPLIWF